MITTLDGIWGLKAERDALRMALEIIAYGEVEGLTEGRLPHTGDLRMECVTLLL